MSLRSLVLNIVGCSRKYAPSCRFESRNFAQVSEWRMSCHAFRDAVGNGIGNRDYK